MTVVVATTAQELPLATPPHEIRWFHPCGSVTEYEGGKCEVHLGGTLLGCFEREGRDRSIRNLLLVTLAGEPKMHLGRLATAFGITAEYLWELRRKAQAGGLAAVMLERAGGKSSVSEQKRRQLRKWFAEGLNPSQAYRQQGRRGKKLSRATISRERARWLAEKTATTVASTMAAAPSDVEAETEPESSRSTVPSAPSTPAAQTANAAQLDLFATSYAVATGVDDDATLAVATGVDDDARLAVPHAPDVENDNAGLDTSVANGNVGRDDNDDREAEAGNESKAVLPQRSQPIRNARLVHHLGTWLMMALAKRDGLHDAAATVAGDRDAVRIALDATIASLSIGEGTVEGVRRLATPTGPMLLRVGQMPTASGVRRRLWSIGESGGGELHARVGEQYIAENRAAADEPAVYYVDNHMRPYNGKYTLRKGWRMQDRRVRAGATDYYVHDEDGRAMFRVDVPSHDTLTAWLMPIAMRLRESLGAEQRILLAFDRAGAFPSELAALRDAGFEVVTYERRPFADLPSTAFDRTVHVRGETYQAHEGRQTNLGEGRGRVRRISLLTPEKSQINLLAVSSAPLERLVEILLGKPGRDDASGRWRQENAFRHGVERWGMNQLDGRKLVSYPPETIIPNPRRRRIERALRVARAEEGRARCQLAALPDGDPRRERVERDLREAVEERVRLELIRPLYPKRAPLEDTELAGKLVHHRGELKTVLDTIRIVCANVEADLAAVIAEVLDRPREAKKVVANILAASGSVSVSHEVIRIRLAPAANRSERVAIKHLFATINGWSLTMPGDRCNRRIEVTLQAP